MTFPIAKDPSGLVTTRPGEQIFPCRSGIGTEITLRIGLRGLIEIARVVPPVGESSTPSTETKTVSYPTSEIVEFVKFINKRSSSVFGPDIIFKAEPDGRISILSSGKMTFFDVRQTGSDYVLRFKADGKTQFRKVAYLSKVTHCEKCPQMLDFIRDFDDDSDMTFPLVVSDDVAPASPAESKTNVTIMLKAAALAFCKNYRIFLDSSSKPATDTESVSLISGMEVVSAERRPASLDINGSHIPIVELGRFLPDIRDDWPTVLDSFGITGTHVNVYDLTF